jgi:hypothetical protein
MGNSHLKTPPGTPGIARRGQAAIDPTRQALSPAEMWRQLVQAQRGFTASPSGAGDRYRSQPATLPPGALDPGARGAPLGKGYETYGALQVLDENGHRVAVAAEAFDGSGPDGHAEARSIRALEAKGPSRVENGRLIVVVDQDICPSCRAKLIAYAERTGISTIEPHLPERASMTRPGVNASPKTSSRSSTQAGRPALTLRADEPIVVRKVGGPPPGGHTGGVRARTAVVGTLAGLGAGALVGILQATFREQMLKSIEKMPRPKVDKRAADEYFKDPHVKGAIRTLDLLDRDLAPFVRDLKARNDAVRGQVIAEILLLGVSPMSPEERLAFASGLDDQLNIYETDLLTIQDNLAAAMALEPGAMEAAKSAEELFALIDTRLAEELLFRNGFAVEDIAGIRDSLKSFQSRVRSAFAQVRSAHTAVDAIVEDARSTHHTTNRLYWRISGEILAARMKAQGLQLQ